MEHHCGSAVVFEPKWLTADTTLLSIRNSLNFFHDTFRCQLQTTTSHPTPQFFDGGAAFPFICFQSRSPMISCGFSFHQNLKGLVCTAASSISLQMSGNLTLWAWYLRVFSADELVVWIIIVPAMQSPALCWRSVHQNPAVLARYLIDALQTSPGSAGT